MLKTLLSAGRHLSFKPHDTATVEGRNKERYRLVALNALASAGSAVIGMLSLFVTIPMVLPYLGAERFGIWMTVASLAGILSFMDLGIGNGLVNLVAQAKTDQRFRLREIVSRGLLLLTIIGLAIGVTMLCLLDISPIEKIIKVSTPTLITETHSTAQTFVVIFALGVPLFGVQRVFFGLQKNWLAQIVKIAAYVASPILVYFVVRQQASIPILLIVTYGVQTISSIALIPFLLREINHGLPITSSGIALKTDLKALIGVGGIYFVLQIGGMIGWGSDALIAAAVLGASAVAPLVIAQRLFQLVTVPLSIINAPLWAAYADAHARQDLAFIQKTLRRSMTFTLAVSAVFSAGILSISAWLTTIWIGPGTNVPYGLLAAFAVWAAMDATGNCFAMYLNGCNIIRIQLVVVLTFCIVAIPLKFVFPEKFGISGILLATITAYAICVALPYSTFLRRHVAPSRIT